ncbi:hypothetical protein I6H07_22935 (plasmid) [Hafnia alvei]|uniref:hypothetical protein n=1 Tax=Hafnia alvei TaxID=569 RepID=UPI000B6CEDFA|nr:hypothetical protein [Hafnia alvei]MBI0278592.1 hypothetical protein [Hafnia alvei]PNL03887.1 hypothetical protein CEQ28_000325 [Hafnia alvei]
MKIFSRKKHISLSTFTLSQAIRLKSQTSDFSYKTESKILTLIFEHLKYNNTLESNYQRNGRVMSIAEGLLHQYVDETGGHGTPTQRAAVTLLFSQNVSRAYFIQEIVQSLEILTNPAFITDGQRRGIILELLRSIKTTVEQRLLKDMRYLAPFIFPITHLPFQLLPAGERQRFISNLLTSVIDSVRNNQVTRKPKLTQRITTPNPDPHSRLIGNGMMYVSNEVLTARIDFLKNNCANVTYGRNPQINRLHPQPNRRMNPPGNVEMAGQSLPQVTIDPVLSQEEMAQREDLHMQLGLLFEHMDKVKCLSPGEKITVYEYEGCYYTPEECDVNNIPKESDPVILDYINEDEYLRRCNAFKAQFTAVLPQIRIMA